MSEHGNAKRQLVLQRLQGREETSLQGHPVGEGWAVQVSGDLGTVFTANGCEKPQQLLNSHEIWSIIHHQDHQVKI